MRPVQADVDLDAVTANVRLLGEVAEGALLCAVVKADGYGHGAVAVARAALAGGADVLGVALVAEGAELRDAQIDAPVLVLSQASPHELDDLVSQGLDATVYTAAGVRELAAASRRAERFGDRQVRVHLKIDTGMHRVGAQPGDAVQLAKAIVAEPSLHLAAVFTHFAVADDPDQDFTAIQLDRFHRTVRAITDAGIDVPMCHAANTAGAMAHPESRLDMVRCGIGIYGLAPSPALHGRLALRPAMSLVAKVSHVNRLSEGEAVSYGLRYRTSTETTMATVPIGYADGVRRHLSEVGAEVLVGGVRRPIAGTITMDQLLVDCGDLPVEVGDDVVLFGRQGDHHIGADEWADRLGTINYEIVCGISPRVPRHYLEAQR